MRMVTCFDRWRVVFRRFNPARRLGYISGWFLFELAILSVFAAEPKRVLIVHSFGNAAPPFTIHSTAFETELTAKIDRKSTRLNSSHQIISYAVFCLKKKK